VTPDRLRGELREACDCYALPVVLDPGNVTHLDRSGLRAFFLAQSELAGRAAR